MTCPSIVIIAFPLLLASGAVPAQTADEQFREPLGKVLEEIHARYGMDIHYDEGQVRDKWVTYARWRYRTDGEQTLTRILALNDMDFTRNAGGGYLLQAFSYHVQSPEEGLAQLKALSESSRTLAEWEARKQALRACIRETLGVGRFPSVPVSPPLLTPLRYYKDYTVQNFALETLPGVYICGSIYRPLKVKGRIPVVFNPDGHFERARYREDGQYRAATLARMGALSVSYDLFGWWGESVLQVGDSSHEKSFVQPLQVHNAELLFDYILSLKEADTSRVAITGASGGGSQSMLMTALDDRIKLSVPVVMMSSWFAGGCPCESGMGIHLCAGGTNNVEIASMAAPRPQLVISDGQDWTRFVPVNDMPFLKRIYGLFGSGPAVESVFLEQEGHDYGSSKRQPMYAFINEHFHLDTRAIRKEDGHYDESGVVIEPDDLMKAFGPGGKGLPSHAVMGWTSIEAMVRGYMNAGK
jgi:hypothetical protein